MKKQNKTIYLHLRVTPLLKKLIKEFNVNVSRTCRRAILAEIKRIQAGGINE